MELATNYMGLELRNPLVASASPLSHTVDGVRRLADAGVGAVVLHSLFEEQLREEAMVNDRLADAGTESFAESLSYFPSAVEEEPGPVAEALIAQACEQQQITREQLTVHADRGVPMRSKPVAFLLADLGVTKTHSRPYTSTDNPYSEAHFKTLKYRPEFPERFGTIEQARDFCGGFFHWYNHKHRHSGIGLMTPAAVHYGRAPESRLP